MQKSKYKEIICEVFAFLSAIMAVLALVCPAGCVCTRPQNSCILTVSPLVRVPFSYVDKCNYISFTYLIVCLPSFSVCVLSFPHLYHGFVGTMVMLQWNFFLTMVFL